MWGKIAIEKEVRDVLIEKVRFEQIFEKEMKNHQVGVWEKSTQERE